MRAQLLRVAMEHEVRFNPSDVPGSGFVLIGDHSRHLPPRTGGLKGPCDRGQELSGS